MFLEINTSINCFFPNYEIGMRYEDYYFLLSIKYTKFLLTRDKAHKPWNPPGFGNLRGTLREIQNRGTFGARKRTDALQNSFLKN